MLIRTTHQKHVFRRPGRKRANLNAEPQSNTLPNRGVDRRNQKSELPPVTPNILDHRAHSPESAITDQRAPTLVPLPPKPFHALDLVGQVLVGRYRVLDPLGAGGMGTVFRAWDDELSVHVALKILPEPAARDPKAVARFRREASLVRGMQHEGVCRAYDYRGDGPVPFFTMELVEGRRLRDVIDDRKLPVHKIYKLLLQVASALEAVHANRIVHRDLKPENILVRRSTGKVVLVDFGLAKHSGNSGVSTTKAIGTLRYMSPEQLNGGRLDARTDVFSFGVMAFELLSGKPPFGAGPDAQVMTAILRDEPALFECRDLVPEAVRDMQKFFELALAKSPAKRFASVAKMRNAFKKAWRARFVKRGARFDSPTAENSAGGKSNIRAMSAWIWVCVLGFRAIVAAHDKTEKSDVPIVSERPTALHNLRNSNANALTCDPLKPTVRVLPFKNSSSDVQLNSLANQISSSVQERLREEPSLHVVDLFPQWAQQDLLAKSIVDSLYRYPQEATGLSPWQDFLKICPTSWLIDGRVQKTNEVVELAIDVYNPSNAPPITPIRLNVGPGTNREAINLALSDLVLELRTRARETP